MLIVTKEKDENCPSETKVRATNSTNTDHIHGMFTRLNQQS